MKTSEKMDNDWKDRLGTVFSTNPDFKYETGNDEEEETLPNNEQMLYVSIDRKQRKGKSVTLIEGFRGSSEDLKNLAKLLKQKCGVGGSSKDNEIIIQGEFKDKIIQLLQNEGYKVKRKGG